MATDPALRQHVVDMLRRTLDRNFEGAMENFPTEAINTRPPNVDWTPYHLLEHLRVGLWDIVEYVKDPQHTSPHWPDAHWPPKDEPADAAAWNKSIEAFRADRDAFIALVENASTDLLAPLPHTPGHTVLRECFLASGHSAGHLGEFSILR